MSKGWIKLHRRIKDHWLYPKGREFTDYEAWQDILLSVNHKERKVRIKNRVLTCKRGQSLRSTKGWAKRWNWSKSKAYRFFSLLEDEAMIETESETVTTRLTVCNYSTYQSNRNGSETQMKRRRNGSETTPDTNKNEKNVKNEKKYSDEFDRFWDIYDVKKGKKKAWQEWKKLSEKEKEEVFNNVPIFLTHFSSKQYTPRPRKYLYNRYWEDEDYQTRQNEQEAQTGLGDNSKFRKVNI